MNNNITECTQCCFDVMEYRSDYLLVGELLSFSKWARNRPCLRMIGMSLSDILSEIMARVAPSISCSGNEKAGRRRAEG